MRFFIALCLLTVLTGIAQADDSADAGAKLYEYFEQFNRQATEVIANEIYSTPLHIGGGTGHRFLEDPAAAVANLNNLYEQVEAQGWVESRISDLKVCIASPTLALVDTRYSRLKDNGEPIPPAIRTTLYVLQKIESEWRIVAFYGHDNDKRPTCG